MPDSPLTVTVLGSGTSHGIPMIACDCAVCASTDPRDKRTRPSITIAYDSTRLLVDTSPELRLQCVANDVRRVDAVLFSGDTLFPGGPGATRFEGADFDTIITSIEERLFRTLDPAVVVLPGHGDDTTVGAESPHLDEWVSRGW